MFESLTLRGGAGTILWGHREAVRLRSWTITQDKKSKAWRLAGITERVDAFQARQRPLLFTSPRENCRNGFWAWAVEGPIEIANGRIAATLGPPER